MSTTFKTNVQDATINNALTVDTNTLYVDPTNNGVCIGTTTLTSGNKLTINGKANIADVLGLAKIATGSLPAAASYQGYVAYDSTLNKFVYSNGSSWVDPSGGGSAYNVVQEEGSSLTARTILNFIGAGITAVDNGGSTRTDVTIHTAGASQEGTVSTGTQTFAGDKTFTGSTTFTTGGSVFNSTNQDGRAILINGLDSARVQFSTRSSDGHYGRLAAIGRSGAGVAIGALSGSASSLQYSGKITFYNQTAAELQSINPAGNGTEVMSITAAGNLSVDTGTFFVDATNNRVGINTTGPARSLDVRGAGNTSTMQVVATDTNGYSAIIFCDTAALAKGAIGYGNSAVASPYTSVYYFNASSGVDTIWLTNGTERIRMASGGNVTFDTTTLVVDVTNNRIGINKASPTTDLDITGAALISSTLGVTGVTTFGAANVYKGATGITAFAGGGQASATALTAEVSFVTTVATTADSVKLPTAALGKHMVVYNDGANSVNIFPISGGQIDALGTNNAYALAAGTSIEFWGKSATDWKSR